MTADVDGPSRVTSAVEKTVDRIRTAGEQTSFYGQALWNTPDAIRRYPTMVLRQIAGMGMGTGALAVIGGTVVIIGFLTLSTGALIAVQGYNTLSNVGIEALTGFLGAFLNVRFIAPATAGVALAATIGAGATAQIGAMRINEEIDAMDVLGINSIAYLVATRAAAAIVAAIPLFFACLATAYLSTQLVVFFAAGQSSGTYLHYFALVMNGRDVAYATIKAVIFVFVASTLQCYYGYYAAGGPAGVGVAAGRAMRSAITIVIVLNMLLTMAMWGVDAGARFGG